MNAVKLNKIFLFICTLFLLIRLGHAQGNAQCGNATPFCTGVPVSYPASTNAGSAPSGPSYGCLGSEPNPAFFFLQMSTSGPVVISMGANNDIDFICWGPYPSLAGVCGNLSANYIQSCSYSPSNTETCTISSAVAGQFYVLLITNFSNQNQQINFTQTNNSSPGAGTTNCGIICGINMSNNGPVCAGQSVTLTATTNTSISSYTLMSSSGVVATSSLANLSNTLTFVVPSVTASTTYSFMASNSSSTCQTTSYVQVIDYPSFTVTPAHPTICQGGNTTVSVTLSPTLTASK